MQTCDDSCVAGTCVIPAEACNGADDDCDSRSDEGFPCEAGSTSPCTATCGSTGTRTCATDCSLGTCTPPAEVCGNAADDDCDSRVDEDCMAMCTGTCPGAVSVAAPGGRRTIAVSGSSMYTGTGACAGATGPEAVLTFTLSSASDVFITTHGSNIDTVLYVRSCTCSGVQIGCNDDSDALPTSVLQLDDLSGGTYTVFADTKAAMSVSLQIDLHISPNDTPGDRCGHPLPFHLTTPVMGNTCMLDSDTNGACPGEYVASLDGPDRIYYFVVTGAPHTVTLDTCTGCSTYDTALDLRRVCTSAGSTERVACDDDQCRSACSAIMRPIQSRLSSSLAPGLYYVFVDGYGTSCGDFTLTAP